MTKQIWRMRGGLLLLGTTLALTGAVAASLPTLVAVARIEPGEWQVKTVGSDAAPRALCVADPSVLLHFNRRVVACDHKVVVDEPDLATVQYRCAGSGSGRTTLRVATPRAFNLDLQGLEGGLPFEDSYEAHRLGDCAGAPR